MRSRGKAAVAVTAVAVIAVAVWLLLSRGATDERGPPQGGPPPPLVETVVVETGLVEETVRAVGSIEAAEQIEVTAQVTGKVVSIHFTEGQRVEGGELLMQLDTESQQAALRVAEAEAREARRQLDRLRAVRELAAAEADIDEARARMETAQARIAEAQAALADRRIVAAFAGTLGLRQVSPGALIQPGTPITTLATLDALKVRFDLPAELLPQLRPGLPVRISAPGFEREFRGRVSHIDNTVDPATRSVTLEATLEGTDSVLKPGVFASVSTVTAVRPDAVLIPEQALLLQGERHYVYVVAPDRTVERRAVAVGERRPGTVEITDGLQAGSRIVVSGLQKVQEGQPVRLADQPERVADRPT